MNTIDVSAADFEANASKYIKRVKEHDDEIVITWDGEPIVEVRRRRPEVRGITGAELAEVLRRLPRLPKAEAGAFARDVEAAQAAGNR